MVQSPMATTDEALRDRSSYEYTHDALRRVVLLAPFRIFTESNANVVKVIRGEVDYNELPYDQENEIDKGVAMVDQQEIIMRNQGSNTLCEAWGMRECLEDSCPLYHSLIEPGPPVCREYKMVFLKK